ncbi:MAG TPA: hypothetical protein VMU90_07320, partial [Solirubrobacteraceae bacterium]|nr:hypothetical protein [Solirubrobacteraceae bacterium]
MSACEPKSARDAGAVADEPSGVPRSWWRSCLVFLGFCGLALIWTLPAWRNPFHSWSGMVGDPIAAMWLLAWTPHAITHGLNPLYTTLLNFPVGVNLAWNPTAPLLGLLSWPALLVGGPILQYNAALTFGVAATAWAGYLAACLRVRRRWLAVLGGLLFGMSPYVVGQALSHPALAVVPGVPLVAVAVEQAWFRHTWGPVRAGAALAGAVLVVLLVSEEVFGSMLIAGGLVLLGCGWTWRASWRLWLPRVLRTSAVAALLVAPVLVGLLVVQFGWPGRILGQPLP